MALSPAIRTPPIRPYNRIVFFTGGGWRRASANGRLTCDENPRSASLEEADDFRIVPTLGSIPVSLPKILRLTIAPWRLHVDRTRSRPVVEPAPHLSTSRDAYAAPASRRRRAPVPHRGAGRRGDRPRHCP